ncbi:MAG: MCE family protein, partial [Bdellovibrionales bacterium]|nr:MCE family protein [Bdellovibrionales bacterium]
MGENQSGTEEKSPVAKSGGSSVQPPKRTFTVELLVGVFTLLGVAAFGYQAIGLAGLSVVPKDEYEIFADFDNVSGLKTGAPVEIAGVPIGEVVDIRLKDP